MKKMNAGSLKEIVRNNSFAVSLIWKHCPFKIVYGFLRSFADGILGTIELIFYRSGDQPCGIGELLP